MRVPILMYHRIAPKRRESTVQGHYVHPKAFARQMKLLKTQGYTAIRLADLYADILPEKPIVITFDDGYTNFYEHALPVLRSVGYCSTVFLVANQIGGTNAWDVQKGDVEEPLMDKAQILESATQGTDFGSHTLDHADLAALDDDAAWQQIADSRTQLQDTLGIPIDTFCYPYGHKKPSTLTMVERAGYRLACSTEKGQNTMSTNRFALRRINVRSDTSLPVFLMKLRRKNVE